MHLVCQSEIHHPFLAEHAHVAVLSTAELRARIPAPDLTLNHSALVASYFDTLFGNIVGPAFRIPENFPPSTTSSAIPTRTLRYVWCGWRSVGCSWCSVCAGVV